MFSRASKAKRALLALSPVSLLSAASASQIASPSSASQSAGYSQCSSLDPAANIEIDNIVPIARLETIATDDPLRGASLSLRRPRLPGGLLPQGYPLIQSRYKHEFVEISKLGFGGFGSVFKCRNVLDGSEYAIKKVPFAGCSFELPSRTTNFTPAFATFPTSMLGKYQKFIQEAKTMAIICKHRNLVRYYHSWVEFSKAPSRKIISEQVSSECDISDDSSGSDAYNSATDASSDTAVVEPDTQNYQIYKATLYIQMQLCRSETLKEWLRRPVRIVSLNEAHDIVRQILLGLDHIHRKNFVHNDIKPGNIFLKQKSGKIKVKLGDFGLASSCSSDGELTKGDAKCGTALYASPEKLSLVSCSSKVDVYAVGIIFLELVSVFGTEMERIGVITDLKQKRHLPRHVSPCTVEGQLILRMTRSDPTLRPSAAELLSEDLFCSADLYELQRQLEDKDRLIAELQQKLSQPCKC